MSHLLLGPAIAAGAFFGGLLGSMTGLGGGIIIVPMLTLLFHVDMRYAIGASLVAVIATSSGAAAAYVREGYTNVRVGIFLELGTTVGALTGALIAGFIPTSVLGALFGVVLLFTAIRSFASPEDRDTPLVPDPWADRLRLHSSYPTASGETPYRVQRSPIGLLLMFGAGILSALLGLGAGIIKVLAMDRAMRLPFKVSTTTSNFMIGVTAAASAGVYLQRGYVQPTIAGPVMIGVLAGALVGSRLLTRTHTKVLRLAFTAVVLVMAVQMLYKGLRGLL